METCVFIRYKNHKNEISWRRIEPDKVWVGSTRWHPETQVFLRAFDTDKGAVRDFAMKDILEWATGGSCMETTDWAIELSRDVGKLNSFIVENNLAPWAIGGESSPLIALELIRQLSESKRESVYINNKLAEMRNKWAYLLPPGEFDDYKAESVSDHSSVLVLIHKCLEYVTKIRDDYATEIRSIELNLAEFWDEKLSYNGGASEAARRAKREIDQLRSDLNSVVDRKNVWNKSDVYPPLVKYSYKEQSVPVIARFAGDDRMTYEVVFCVYRDSMYSWHYESDNREFSRRDFVWGYLPKES